MAESVSIELRPCTAADASILALVGAATFLESFAGVIPGDAVLAHCAKHHVPEAYRLHFQKSETRAWLAEAAPGAAPVGYALLTAPEFPSGLLRASDLELRRIYLLSRFHGTGAGPRLMDAAVVGAREQGARRVLLGVHPENHRALAFYRRNGFRVIGQRQFQVGASVFQDPVLALEL